MYEGVEPQGLRVRMYLQIDTYITIQRWYISWPMHMYDVIPKKEPPKRILETSGKKPPPPFPPIKTLLFRNFQLKGHLRHWAEGGLAWLFCFVSHHSFWHDFFLTARTNAREKIIERGFHPSLQKKKTSLIHVMASERSHDRKNGVHYFFSRDSSSTRGLLLLLSTVPSVAVATTELDRERRYKPITGLVGFRSSICLQWMILRTMKKR